LRKAIWARRGILKLPTGAGKTIVSAAIAKYLNDSKGLSSLMIVPGVNSLNQSWARWRAYGLSDVGRLGDGHQDFNARHLIAVVNSAYQIFGGDNEEARRWAESLGCIMWMEAHHAQAMMWAEIGKMADVPYRFGLTATPFVNGGDAETYEDYTILGLTGKIVANVSDSLLMNLGVMAVPRVHFLRIPSKCRFNDTNWHVVKKAGITTNEPRNIAMINMASRLAEAGRKVIVLINEIEHCKMIARGVSKEIGSALVFHGGSKLLFFKRGIERKSNKTEIQELNQYLEEMDSYVLVGSPAIDEDADFPSADTLIIGAGGRSPRRVVQRAGRVLRPKPDSNEVDIIDFEDFGNVVLRSHSKSRRTTYQNRYVGARGFNIFNHATSDSVIGSVLGVGIGGVGDGIEEVSVR
jgi:superfamily II DNA or RNA helicase